MRFDVQGLIVETKVPTLAQLTTIKQAPKGLGDYDACRSLVKGSIVSPSFVELLKRRPSCVAGLALQIAIGCGVGGAVRLLEEPEIESEEQAAAYVEQADRLAKLYADPEDERRIVMPVVVETEGGAARAFLLRRPIESEIERYRKANTAEAAKLLVSKVALWGPVAELEADLPGVYLTLADCVLDVCGDYEARLVGES
jgi:hypothetical protein